jgi:outer membrane protein assembly factor BamB
MRKYALLIAGAVGLLAVGGAVAAFLVLHYRHPSGGHLETRVTGVSLQEPRTRVLAKPPKLPRKAKARRLIDSPCWRVFGGNPRRSLSRLSLRLGRPTKPIWATALHGLVEYPPSYCQGVLYVNTYLGRTYALRSRDGKILWSRKIGGRNASTPAIAGPRLIVTSRAGTVTALERVHGRLLWRLHVRGRVESSPVVIGRYVYFGVTDGHLYALGVRTGRVRWAYQTGGRMNSSPSIFGHRIFVTTYSGSIFALNRFTGHRIWVKFVRRDPLRYDSFYASGSTDGKRVYTISRSGKVVCVSARNGRILWTRQQGGYGYSTPSIGQGRVFVGGFDGYVRAYQPRTGRVIWRTYLHGRILAPGFVIGKLVFFATLENRTFALSTKTGRIVWRYKKGRYSPGIATNRHYYFAFAGRMMAFRGVHTQRVTKQLLAQRRKLRHKKRRHKG